MDNIYFKQFLVISVLFVICSMSFSDTIIEMFTPISSKFILVVIKIIFIMIVYWFCMNYKFSKKSQNQFKNKNLLYYERYTNIRRI